MKWRILLASLLCSVTLVAQYNGQPDYPKGYFRNPLNIPIDLSGNFGELRPNHYHMGLDLKTQKRENLPVFAAADGYISRIKIEPAGFGRAIYVDHPNGITTVYCHLNDFFPALEDWVKGEQYHLESWKVMLELPPNRFPVKKGDFLAYSGNTGGSQAPHLHFEIRRTKDDVNLNPMLFGFPLQDNTSPSILRLAIYDRNKSVYEQSPRLLATARNGDGFRVPPQVVATNKVSLAITAYDTHTGSSNQNGVYEAVLYDNDKAVVGFRMDQVGYDATRYLNAHIDYKTKSTGGPYLQHLSELPGYLHSIYTRFSGDGVIDLSDGQVHDIRIVVKDGYGNSSTLQTSLQYNGAAYTISAPAGRRFYPMMVDVYETEDCEFVIGERTLYDSVTIQYHRTVTAHPEVVSAVHSIGAPYIPLQDSMVVRIQPVGDLSPAEKERTVMQRFAGNKKDVLKVQWQRNWAMARFRDFGSFQLVLDNKPPEILPIGFSDGANLAGIPRIVFTVKDNLEKWKVLRTELDGKWIRFTNDKGKSFVYRFDEKCPPGEHTLRIVAEDEAGNRTEKQIRFKR
ncbi:peptidoglycan DD-metalloendopeptidase family protein [Flavihumibacter rivuli]|uniref:peptidoglycan DD-metalloendopeptidase family protein n=1 Tax=Flavihumibacter rivuli TaxID=2838156 RepID=UPI001BDF64ED|nr:peptidoglycan DD-metalloendopeptidase family protein [Flavihumibacter rivuli]ULQ55133.1 peptidoglycan DD-metalloendopeptidase family protein [Flavihumibacter rivuli]